MRYTKRLLSAAIGATVALVCVSCAGIAAGASGPATSAASASSVPVVSPATELVRSEACSWAAIIDWDGSPGPETAVGAVQEILEGLERQLDELPEGAAARTPVSDSEHPVRLKISVRGLQAVLDVLEQQNDGRGQGGEVLAYTDDGEELARVVIEPAGAGSTGFRVGMYAATGWTTDDPLCTEDAESAEGVEGQ